MNDKQGTTGTIEVWDIKQLRPNPLNPRGELDPAEPRIKALADSIREKGLIEPLVIARGGLIVAGHRRHLACKLAGVNRVRVIVRNLSKQEQLELMLVENIQREALDTLQEARAYRNLIDSGLCIADIARRTGINQHTISESLDIIALPVEVHSLFGGEIPLLAKGCVRLLRQVRDPAQQILWAKKAAGARWTVGQLQEALTGRTKRKLQPATKEGPTSPVLTRDLALESLARKKGWPFTLELVQRALDRTPCSCSGLDQAKHSTLCRDCPLSAFLTVLVQEAHDATA